jgi:predicted Holliday junction resolvase-like endonuclease
VIEWLVLLVLLALAALYHKRRTAAIKRHYEEALERQRQEYENKMRELLAHVETRAAERAQRIFDEWRAKELESLKAQYDKLLAEKTEAIKKEYEALFEKWKQVHEARIRRDAVQRSLAVTLGRVGEELAPLLIFKSYGIEPKDLRHIGTPVDYIAFKGLSEGRVDEIVFIEVKTGKSTRLSGVEKEVEKAVEEGKVRFLVVNVKEELERLAQRLTQPVFEMVEV